MSPKNEESAGLDIGSYSIKVVSLRKTPGGKELVAYNIKRLPFDEKKQNLEKFVREALDEIDFHPDRVNLAISGTDVIVRFINLPKMTKDQLEKALVFEAEKHIPFNINEVVLDSIILGDAAEPGQMRVLLAAAKREPIENITKMFESMKMTVNVMDMNPFAMFNSFIESRTLPENSGTAFLDMGHSRTDILISVGKSPCFMRQIQIGGKDVNDTIARELSIPSEKAGDHKTLEETGNKEAVNEATTSVLDPLIKEMQLSFGYFENRYNSGITNIFCSGGMIYREGVVDYLRQRLGLEVKSWNPVEGLKISENLSKQDIDSVASELAVSIGLALRG